MYHLLRMRFIVGFFFSMMMVCAYAYNPQHVEQFKATGQCESCDFNELNVSPAVLGMSDVRGAVLSGTYFYGSGIEDLQFSHVNAREITGLGLMLHNNELSYADFSYSDLPNLKVTMWNRGEYVQFTGSTLDEANFSYTQFNAPQLSGASMSSAVLYRVNWPQANLSGTRLRYANLTYAQLRGADLTNANLTDALLSHADLSNANLFGAQVTDEQLAKTLSVCNAILPDGSMGDCKV